MPLLRVTKNGTHLCSVGSNDVWTFSASLRADIWGPERSELTVTGGGKRLPDGSSDFLIWQMSHELKEGDRIGFSFEEGVASSPKGEVFIGEPTPDTEKIDFFGPVPEDEIVRLERRPTLNTKCAWRFVAPDEAALVAAPDETRQNVSLHILWNDMRPNRMRVNLWKSSLREVTSRSEGEELFLRYVEIGAHVEVSVGI